MKIIDTMNEIEIMAATYDGNKSTIMKLWRDYMKVRPKLQKLCEEDMVGVEEEDRYVSLMHDALTVNLDKVREAHKNFLKVVGRVEEKFSALFETEEEVDLYFYMGLGNGAGWAATIDGKGSMLFGAEKIADLGWQESSTMLGLVSHELAHEGHRLLRGQPISQNFTKESDTWVWRLYTEGFAQKFQQVLQGDESYHQNKEDGVWLSYCEENCTRLKEVYKQRILNEESAQDFYGDWTKFENQADLGYYLGSVWVDELFKKFTIKEIAVLPFEKVKSELFKFLD
jgi:hypothetical protein